MNRLQNWLDGIGAPKDLIDLPGSQTLQGLWNECDRGDHMLWLLRRMAGKPGWPTLPTVIGLCCDCAELARDRWSGDVSANCIATLRAWCRGEATIGKVIAAVDAVRATLTNPWASYADASDAVAFASANAVIAAAAATYTTYSANDAAAAAAAAVAVCDAFAFASAAPAAAAAASRLRQCANIIRAAVPTLPEIPQEGGES